MAGFADPAEGQFDPAAGAVIVDEDLTHIQLARHAHLPRAVAGPQTRNQPVFGAIGDPQRLGLVLEGDQDLHRAEDLFLRKPVIGGHLGEKDRGDVMPGLWRIGKDRAFRRHGQVAFAERDIIRDDLLLLGRNQRTEIAVIGRGADFQPGIDLGHAPADLVIDAALHQHPRCRRTGLPGPLHAGPDKRRQRRFQIDIVEDDMRGFSAQFQRHRHDIPGRRLLDMAPGHDRSGEGHMIHPRMRRQSRPDLGPIAGDHVQRARRQPGFGGKRREGKRGQRGILGRFQHAGIAHRQRRPDRTPEDLHRVVPGDDMGSDTMRFAQGIDGKTFLIRDGGAMQLVGGTAVEFEVTRQRDGIVSGLFHRLADIGGFEEGQFLGPLHHQPCHPGQDPAAFQRRGPAPFARQRQFRGSNGLIDIRRRPLTDGTDHRAGRGVFDRDRRRIAGRLPLAADEDHGRIEPERLLDVHVIFPLRWQQALPEAG